MKLHAHYNIYVRKGRFLLRLNLTKKVINENKEINVRKVLRKSHLISSIMLGKLKHTQKKKEEKNGFFIKKNVYVRQH